MLAVAAITPVVLQAAGAPNPPFTLTWTQGRCVKCQTAKELAGVELLSEQEAWGIGYDPPGETGSGDYVIVHSRDGGETWRELPSTYQHNGAPAVSFSDKRSGWLTFFDMNSAEGRLLQTNDGGIHWNRLPLRNRFFSAFQYLGQGTGYAVEFSPYKTPAHLLATRDYGQHWDSSPLPNDLKPGPMVFVNDRHGLLAGCVGHDTVIARTFDRGRHWALTPLDLPPSGAAVNEGCGFEVDSLDLVDDQQGWLVVNQHVFGPDDNREFSAVYRTADGGSTWMQVFEESNPESPQFFANLWFLNPRLGFIMKGIQSTGTQAFQEEIRWELLYTTDSGQTWQGTELPRAAGGCHQYHGGLACGSADFRLLKISPRQ